MCRCKSPRATADHARRIIASLPLGAHRRLLVAVAASVIAMADAAQGPRKNAVEMDGSYRAYYMNDFCSEGQKSLPVHLPVLSEQASVVLFSHRRNSTPKSGTCRLPFQVESAAKFTLSFRFFDTVSDSFICHMYLELISSSETTDLLCGKDYTGTKSMEKTSSTLTLKWTVSQRNVLKRLGGFEIVITGFEQPDSGGCGSGLSKCANNRCIWHGFKCDGKDNCGDYSDERLCFAGMQDFSLYVIALFLVTLLLLAVGVVFKIMYDKYAIAPLDAEAAVPGADVQVPGSIQTVLLPGPPPAMIVKKMPSGSYLDEGAPRPKPSMIN